MRRATDGLGGFFVPGSEVRVVIADRDERVHDLVKKALGGVEVAGSRVVVEHAFTGEDARKLCAESAVLLLEGELDARATLLHLREELADARTRVLLRASGPDLPLDEAQLEELRVDGFLDEDDLATPVRLYVAVRTALRSYAHAVALEKQVDGLGQIAERLTNASTKGTLGGLLQPLVEDIASNCWTNDWLCVPFLDDLDAENALVLAGGSYAANATPAAAREAIAQVRAELDASTGPILQLRDGRLAVKFLDPKTRGTAGVLLIASQGPPAPRVKALAQSLGHKLSIARQNIDLSQKLEREKEAAREIYNDRMGMLGRLAASVAHELNTPLGIALHACSLLGEYRTALAEKPADPGPVLADLDEAVGLVVRNVTAAANLVRSFKGMAVDQASDQDESFDPARIVTDAVHSLLHVLRPKGQTVRLEGAGGPVKVTNNPGALSQVVNNLVLNASKHGYKDGPGEILVRHEAHADAFEIVIEDKGEGMDDRVARRVFEPFVTTAKGKGGSGLGMSIVHHIVTATFRGRIDVESTRGQGTRFRVRFPLTPA